LSLRILRRDSRASSTPGVVAVRVVRRRRSRVLRYRVVICSHFVCVVCCANCESQGRQSCILFVRGRDWITEA
jgi:hypothetical protein